MALLIFDHSVAILKEATPIRLRNSRQGTGNSQNQPPASGSHTNDEQPS